MRRLRRFLRLSSSERGLLMRAILFVTLTRVGLWLLPLQAVRHELARVSQAPPQPSSNDLSCLDAIAWAVKAASRYIPHATCLTQALAAQVLVERAGLPSRVCLGVARGEGRTSGPTPGWRARAGSWWVGPPSNSTPPCSHRGYPATARIHSPSSAPERGRRTTTRS